MDIYMMPRAGGKTRKLIELSANKKLPILVGQSIQIRFITDMAKEMGLKIPQPLCVEDVLTQRYRGSDNYEAVLVDEMPFVLQQLVGKRIEAVTFTPND